MITQCGLLTAQNIRDAAKTADAVHMAGCVTVVWASPYIPQPRSCCFGLPLAQTPLDTINLGFWQPHHNIGSSRLGCQLPNMCCSGTPISGYATPSSSRTSLSWALSFLTQSHLFGFGRLAAAKHLATPSLGHMRVHICIKSSHNLGCQLPNTSVTQT